MLMLTITVSTASAQYTAVRVNTLGLVTGTINMGVDIAPMMEVVEIEVTTMIAGSMNAGGTLPGTGNGGDSEGDGNADGNRHRGEWGNLWK